MTQVSRLFSRASFNGQPTRFVVAAYKDDSDAPDLYFFTTPDVAAKIDKEFAAFSLANASSWRSHQGPEACARSSMLAVGVP